MVETSQLQDHLWRWSGIVENQSWNRPWRKRTWDWWTKQIMRDKKTKLITCIKKASLRGRCKEKNNCWRFRRLSLSCSHFRLYSW